MRFGLSEEQELLQQTLRGFLDAECSPSRLREIFDAGIGTDGAIWQGLAGMGLTGLVVPDAYGGAGLPILELALACEVSGERAMPGPFLEHSLACLALAVGGSEVQQRRWLPDLAAGAKIATIALCEAGSCWEPESWGVTEKDGKLTGTKTHVPHAELADLFVVGVAGGQLAVVEREPATVTATSQDGIDRTRRIGRLVLADAAGELLGGGPETARRIRDAGLVCLAADSFGAATRLIELSVDYAKDRKQFGFPIAQFQSVKHQLARMGTDIEPTRALFWYAAHALDEHLPDAERQAALANAHITDRALSVARDAVELHGGLGFTWACDVQIWFKRAMFNRALLGAPEALRERCAKLAGW